MKISKNPTLSKIDISGISETTIINYFTTLNANDFTATSTLFVENGILYPPFESAIIGQDNISKYLHQEAQDVKAYPQQGISQNLPDYYIEIQVTGKAETSWCSVNVSWSFILNPQRKITKAKIQLLASPQELLSLRQPDKEYHVSTSYQII